MDLGHRPPSSPPTAGPGAGAWSSLVLVDADHDMWLVRVRFTEPPRRGLVFWFGELQWQVERVEPFGCTAVPVAM